MTKNEIINTVMITIIIILICIFILFVINGVFVQKNVVSDYRNVITSNNEHYCNLLINDNWISTNEICDKFIK